MKLSTIFISAVYLETTWHYNLIELKWNVSLQNCYKTDEKAYKTVVNRMNKGDSVDPNGYCIFYFYFFVVSESQNIDPPNVIQYTWK